VVERGRGYSPSEERGSLPIGEIPVDAVFSPVVSANYTVERARVAKMTNYDRLILEIKTDGTISPQDALREAARILVEHFTLIAGVTVTQPVEEVEVGSAIPASLYEVPIEELELSVRAYNCLKRAGITQVGEILERLRKGENEILAIRNFGQKSLDELLSKLEEKGFLAVLQGQKDQLAEIPEVSETVEESEPVELTAEEEPIS